MKRKKYGLIKKLLFLIIIFCIWFYSLDFIEKNQADLVSSVIPIKAD